MTRARARATETEVISFLFELHPDSHESWVLPQMETLCIIRYQEEVHEEARRETQAPMEEEEEGRVRREAREVSDLPGCPATKGPGARPPPAMCNNSP